MIKESNLKTIVDIKHIHKDGLTLNIKANADELKQTAERLEIPKIKSLTAKVNIKPQSFIEVFGKINAQIEQQCVVSLETIHQNISTEFKENFSSNKEDCSSDLDFDIEEVDCFFAENGKIDIGELIIQHLSLQIDPYPRKENLTDPVVVEEKDTYHPFEKLKQLKK